MAKAEMTDQTVPSLQIVVFIRFFDSFADFILTLVGLRRPSLFVPLITTGTIFKCYTWAEEIPEKGILPAVVPQVVGLRSPHFLGSSRSVRVFSSSPDFSMATSRMVRLEL